MIVTDKMVDAHRQVLSGIAELSHEETRFALEVAIAASGEPNAYLIGDRTMRAVFEANGIKNLSDMQAVFDAMEKALAQPPVPHKRGIFIASKTKHADRWRFLRDKIGEPIISTWIDEAGAGESNDLADLWRRCILEASTAELLILYREPEDVLKGGWVELGAALASGVTVFAVGVGEFTIAHDKRIRHFPDMKAAIAAARELRSITAPVSNLQGWQAHDLISGRAYESIHFGTVTYLGIDTYHGETTHAFEVGRHQRRYWKTEKLGEFLKPKAAPAPASRALGMDEAIPGEHQEVLDALEAHNSGEDHG